MKVIGAGYGRTGTSSLKAALELLGFGPCHHMDELFAHPEQIRLALIQAASLGGVVALGPRSGRRAQRTQRLGGRERALPARCASFAGYNLHAGVVVRAGEREGLERLARYVLRPPLAKDRLSRRGEDVALGLKRAWSDGSTEIILSPSELVERLVVTIPPPRTNTVLYHGLFAGAHRWRSRVVPGPKAERAAVVARRRARKLTKTPSPLDDAKESWAAAAHGSAVTRGCG